MAKGRLNNLYEKSKKRIVFLFTALLLLQLLQQVFFGGKHKHQHSLMGLLKVMGELKLLKLIFQPKHQEELTLFWLKRGILLKRVKCWQQWILVP